jgi:hypothetical protein
MTSVVVAEIAGGGRRCYVCSPKCVKTLRWGERRGRAAWRLGKKAGGGERGDEERGTGGPKMTGGDGTSTKGSGGERGVESRGGGGPAAL